MSGEGQRRKPRNQRRGGAAKAVATIPTNETRVEVELSSSANASCFISADTRSPAGSSGTPAGSNAGPVAAPFGPAAGLGVLELAAWMRSARSRSSSCKDHSASTDCSTTET